MQSFEEFLIESTDHDSFNAHQHKHQQEVQHHSSNALEHAHKADAAKAAGDHDKEKHHVEQMHHHLKQHAESSYAHALPAHDAAFDKKTHGNGFGHEHATLDYHSKMRKKFTAQAKKHPAGSHSNHAANELSSDHSYARAQRKEYNI